MILIGRNHRQADLSKRCLSEELSERAGVFLPISHCPCRNLRAPLGCVLVNRCFHVQAGESAAPIARIERPFRQFGDSALLKRSSLAPIWRSERLSGTLTVDGYVHPVLVAALPQAHWFSIACESGT